MSGKNLYYAWANNNSGANLDVNDGGKTNSIRELENAARRELGSGWQVHIMQVHIDGDGQSVMGVSEVKAFTIR